MPTIYLHTNHINKLTGHHLFPRLGAVGVIISSVFPESKDHLSLKQCSASSRLCCC